MMNSMLRSYLFVPGHVEKFFLSALKSEADVFVFDLEDSVPPDQKDHAREVVAKRLRSIQKDRPVLVRLNADETGRLQDDVRAVLCASLDGVILPKVKTADDIIRFDAFLTSLEEAGGLMPGHCRLFPLIETCAAVMNVDRIAAASDRNAGLVFGHEDFLLDLRANHSKNELNLLVPRMRISMAARMCNLHAVDTPYLDIKNVEGCRDRIVGSRELGFSGMLVLHPVQIKAVNDGYAPTPEEVAEARRIIEQVENSSKEGRSIAFQNGRFTAPPILKQAKQILEQHECNSKKGKQ